MVESNLSGSDDEEDQEYVLLEELSRSELEKVLKELLLLPQTGHSLYLREKVSNCEE